MVGIVKTARDHFVLNREGKKTGVIVPLARYRRLLEDLHDLAVVAERRGEKPLSMAKMKRRLRAHGLV